MSNLPRKEARRRVAALQERMRAAEPPIDLVVLVQNVDVYYFSGTFQNCHLVVPAEGEPLLLVRKVLERAREDSPLQNVRPLSSLKKLRGEMEDLSGPPPWRVGFELDVLSGSALEVYRRVLGAGVELLDASAIILSVRSVKSEWEIDRIREASEPIARIFRDLPVFLEDDLSSHELTAILDCRARTAGHPGVIRMRGLNVETAMGVVVSGPTGAVPSHSFFPVGGQGMDPSWPAGGDLEIIQRDTPILMDYLGCHMGYYADQTRMAVKGKLPAEAQEIFNKLQEILRHCEQTVRAGSVPSAVYHDVVARAEERNLSAGFMGPPGFSVGFVGHGVGLEVNEMPVLAPRFDQPLLPGTVLAIEPKFTHPALGVIGIENTYVVREDHLENLTTIAETVIEV